MLRSIPLRAPVCVPSMWICLRPEQTNMAEFRTDEAHLGKVERKIQPHFQHEITPGSDTECAPKNTSGTELLDMLEQIGNIVLIAGNNRR